MGIQGLLPQLKSIADGVDVRSYAGLTVGIDASVWLHRGVYGCARELALGQPTEGYVRYCEGMLNLLLAAGVIPYFVFDGGYLPMKGGTEGSRRVERDKAMAAGLEAHARGDAATAYSFFTRAVDVTPAMAASFMRVLRRRGVAFVVAPYEADSQLAFMARVGILQVREGARWWL
jgi:5'-3' exonuclease